LAGLPCSGFYDGSYVYIIIFCIQLLKRKEAPHDKRMVAVGVLLLWIFIIPAMLAYLGGTSAPSLNQYTS
jgi:hypothetical protein